MSPALILRKTALPPVPRTAAIYVAASILSSTIKYMVSTGISLSAFPLTVILFVPPPETSNPHVFINPCKSTISGSHAQFSMTVSSLLQVAAIIRFSVAPTLG